MTTRAPGLVGWSRILVLARELNDAYRIRGEVDPTLAADLAQAVLAYHAQIFDPSRLGRRGRRPPQN